MNINVQMKCVYRITFYKTKLLFELDDVLFFKNLLEVSRSNRHLVVGMSPSLNLEQLVIIK